MASLARTLARPFVATGHWYSDVAKKHPVMTAVITTGLKTSAADLFAQKVVEKREKIDWVRHTAFSAFGIIYLGGFQYWLYNIKFTQLCAPITARYGHRAVAPIKVFLDQGIHHPLLYFPFFYGLKTFVERKPMSQAVDRYKREIKDSCLALWKIWVPAQLVNFALVPRHLRIPYVALVSFGWTVVLSTMQGKFAKQEEEAAAALAAAASSGASGGAKSPALAVAAASTAASSEEARALMRNIVATGGVPSPSSSTSSTTSFSKKGGGDAAVPAAAAASAAAPSKKLGGLTDLPSRGDGGGGSKRRSPATIVAASRAEEAASIVGGCASGAGPVVGGGAAAA